jgi:hypothetical protein
MTYEPELLEALKQKKFVDLTSIEKCLFTEDDWILQNSALQELRSYREQEARIAELERYLDEVTADEFSDGAYETLVILVKKARALQKG